MDGGSGGERNVISFRMDGEGEREMLLVLGWTEWGREKCY